MISLMLGNYSKEEKLELLELLESMKSVMENKPECLGKCATCKYYSLCVDLRNSSNWLIENI